MVICQRRASMLSSARISGGSIIGIPYKRCCYRYKHVAASALADNDVPDRGRSSDGFVEEAGQLSTNKSLPSVAIPPKPLLFRLWRRKSPRTTRPSLPLRPKSPNYTREPPSTRLPKTGITDMRKSGVMTRLKKRAPRGKDRVH